MELAPCGLNCDTCSLRHSDCDGCHSNGPKLWCDDCPIRVCCKFERRLSNCSECTDFPCQKVLDFEADKYAHHTAAVKLLREMHRKRGG